MLLSDSSGTNSQEMSTQHTGGHGGQSILIMSKNMYNIQHTHRYLDQENRAGPTRRLYMNINSLSEPQKAEGTKKLWLVQHYAEEKVAWKAAIRSRDVTRNKDAAKCNKG